MKKIIATIFLVVSVLASFTQNANNANDSLRLVEIQNWKITHSNNNLIVKELHSNSKEAATYLFGAPAHIYVMEFPSAKYRVQPVQQPKKMKTSKLQRSFRAVASVNGGFFVVNPESKNAAVANDFLKINGRVVSPNPPPGWGSGAFALSKTGALSFAMWNKSMDADTVNGWSAQFANVMVAGPMLILDGETIRNADRTRHPRTAIGTRPDGTVLLIVADGRRRRASGLSFDEMATIGRLMGLRNMLNLDGGGSSTMLYKNDLINFPSDGLGIIPLQRKVANAVVVLPK